MRANKARAGHRTGQACHRRWNAYGTSPCKGWSVASVIPVLGGLALLTRGRSRVPELGLLGSVRGALSNEWPLYVAPTSRGQIGIELGYAAGRFASLMPSAACE